MEFTDIDLKGIYKYSINGEDFETTGEDFRNRLIELKVHTLKGVIFDLPPQQQEKAEILNNN